MTCPNCGTRKMLVTDTADDGTQVIRRRKCRQCGHLIYTAETKIKSWQASQLLARIKNGGEYYGRKEKET